MILSSILANRDESAVNSPSIRVEGTSKASDPELPLSKALLRELDLNGLFGLLKLGLLYRQELVAFSFL